MTRKVVFSAGHRYWIPALGEVENRRLFGHWASPYNHGHNYTLEVTVEGAVDGLTGMIVNIKVIDDIVREQVLRRFDQRSINDEIEHFKTRSASTENILLHIAELLRGQMPSEASLVHLRLYEMDTLYVDLDSDSETMTLTRVYEFAAAHRLHVPQMSTSENIALFGKCNNEAGHGHNYVLEVTVAGAPDPQTGMMVDIGALDAAVEEIVLGRYDHKHLNVDVPEFASKTPTSEVIAEEIFSRLDGKLPAKLQRIRLHETARNIFEVSA